MGKASRRDSGLALVIEAGNQDEQGDMAIARQVSHALNQHYPGHPWVVSVQGRGIVLRHQMISMVAGAFLRKEGFSFLMPREKMRTPREITHSAIQAGGSMLELFSLPRGEDTGQLPEIPRDWRAKMTKGFS